MGQTGQRSIATHILAVKIVSAAAHFRSFGVALAGPWNTVEKVVVGPVGSPRESENKAKTLPKRRIQPLNRGQKRAQRSFSTGCCVFTNGSRNRLQTPDLGIPIRTST